MINKSKMWFLTLSSVILVLGVYYIGLPKDAAEMVFKNSKSEQASIDIEESETLTAMRVNKDESREKDISVLQETLLDSSKSIDEKNEAYEKIQYLNANNTIEEKIEKKIKEEFKINSFVQIDDSNLKITLVNVDSSYKFANKIISMVNKNTNNSYYVSVKFE